MLDKIFGPRPTTEAQNQRSDAVFSRYKRRKDFIVTGKAGWLTQFLFLSVTLFAAGLWAFPAAARTTQPPVQLFIVSDNCLACHNGLTAPSGRDVSIGANWQSSMMANSARDPYWQASVRRETLAHPKAADSIQDECSACHMPMTRYRAKVANRKGRVFQNLPIATQPINAPAPQPAAPKKKPARTALLAADGVSCSMCHQIKADKLGTEASFVAGFVVDTKAPLGKRDMFGPYDVKDGYSRIMESAVQWVPTQKTHVQDSALCASCHTLYTHTRGPDGETIGRLPEQVPYLEWKHSDFYQNQSCQSCHMPQLTDKTHITSVLGEKRAGFSRHVFRGGNFFMPLILKRHRQTLGVVALPQDLDQAAMETEKNLKQDAARIDIPTARIDDGRLIVDVAVSNLTGHKLPTAYPSRRAWIHLTIRNARGQVVFESGAVNPDGSIQGNVNDADRDRYERHRSRIDHPDQVQIYEAIMADPDGDVTTGLIEAIRFIKDNRVLPRGFDKAAAPEDIAVQGPAYEDDDFKGASDRVRYIAPVRPQAGPFTVSVRFMYQPIAFRWAQNLKQQEAEEIDRFVGYYEAMSDRSWKVLARAETTVTGR
jgi:hypothetical protein